MRMVVKLMVLALAMLSAPAALAAGCAIGSAGTTERIAIGGTGRSMLMHFPKGFAHGRAPLVWLFHGSTGNGDENLKRSKMADTSDAHGFIVAAPDGGISVGDGGFVWNIPGVPTVTGKIPGAEDADDVAFVLAATDWLAKRGCIDSARVYATGISGGGRMTSWLACVAADRFAAIAPVVGLRAGNPLAGNPRVPDPATCKPSRPMPVIAFAGDADKTNPIEGGGAGYWKYTMHTAESRWADLNGCRSGPVTRDVTQGLYEERYSRCRNDADVVARITRGGPHMWLADNEAMWAFLSKYRRLPLR